MTAVVYSTGAGYDDAGSSATPFAGSVAVTAGQGVYAWITHNGSAPGLYKGTLDDGVTTYAMTTLGTWTTPGGDTIAIAYLKAPATMSPAYVRWALRDAGDTTNVSVTGFDRGYVVVTGQHGTSPHATLVTASNTGGTVTGASTAPGVDALLLTFVAHDTDGASVSGEIGTERIENFKTTVITQPVSTSASVNETGTLSASDGWRAVTIPILPAVAAGPAPSFSNVGSVLKSGTPNDIRISFRSNVSTSGLTVTATATTPNQPTPVTSSTVTWSGSDGYIDLLDLGPGEPWTFTITGDNGTATTVGAGEITIRALSLTGLNFAPSGYSETALAWRDRATNEVVTGVTVAAGSTVSNPPYLAVTLLTGDVVAKDGVTPSSSDTGKATVGATGTNGVSTITGVAAGSATISATSGSRTASLAVTVTGPSSTVTPTWVTSGIPSFQVGVAGSYRLQATDATSYSASGLPSGATLAPDGLLTWTPGSAVSASVTFTATSASGGTANRTLTVASSTAAAPVITTTSPITAGTVATAYSKAFAATGTGPITWAATGVPAGLTFTSGGLLSGTPLFPGSSEIVVSATNSAGTTTGTFVLAINAAASAAQVSSAWAPILRGK